MATFRVTKEQVAQFTRDGPIFVRGLFDAEDVYTAICHSRRMVETMAKVLEDEVYLDHYKTMVKEPRVGGAAGAPGQAQNRWRGRMADGKTCPADRGIAD